MKPHTKILLKGDKIIEDFCVLAKLSGGRTNLGQPPVADVLSEVRSGETSNVRCADLRRLSLRASSATLTGAKQSQAAKRPIRCLLLNRFYTVLSLKDYQIWDGFFVLAKLNEGDVAALR